MNIMVFAGPSLSGHDWSEEPGLIHLPPARAGDVYRAVRRGANAIGLIDGVFELCPAVRHKEILWALSQGVHMYGAASIGALRAAECERYGMRGVGDVFAQYAAGDLVDDDEVALTHAPAAVDYQPLSEAMVNIRATLRAARADSVVDDGLCDALLDTAKKAYFKRRTWPRLLAGLDSKFSADAATLKEWLSPHRVDCKRADALELLAELRRFANGPPRRFVPRFQFRGEGHWEWSRRTFEAAEGVIDAADTLVLDELRLSPARFQSYALVAWAKGGSREQSHQYGLTAEERFQLVDEFRIRHGLESRKWFEGWMQSRGIDQAELERFLGEEAAFEDFMATRFREAAPAMLTRVKISGEYDLLHERGQSKQAALAQEGVADTEPEDGIEVDELVDWFENTLTASPRWGGAEHAARLLGLPGPEALATLLWRERWFQEHIGGHANTADGYP